MNEASFHGLPLPLRVRPARPMTDEELMRFGTENEMLDFEREPNGEIHLWPIGGTGSSVRRAAIATALGQWSDLDGSGNCFLNGGWSLPDGSMRAADLVWVEDVRTHSLTLEQREGYAPTVPNFVIEVVANNKTLAFVQNRMNEWMKNGAELGWILDPFEKTVHIYRQSVAPEILTHISQVAGEGPVAGFVLPLDRIFR